MSPLLPPRATGPVADVDPTRVKSIMEKVRQIELRIRGLVDTSLAGGYLSAFRGRGIDFDQVREYFPGDEVRTIDWNVTARAGAPFVKQYREERELTLMLLVDVSASGDFGSTQVRKRELAAELACVLAMSATRNNDLVGLIMFSDRIERFVPPAKGRSHALRIVREILGCTPEGRGTDLAAALQLAGSLSHRRAVMFLISDLEVGADREPALDSLRRAARPVGRRHDVLALHVRDPHECALPDVGLLTVEDNETGEVISIDTGRRKVRERFAKISAARAAETKLALRAANIETVEIDTSKPYITVLLQLFARRGRRLR
ncbi:MAG: DUF58 domain-containing protein [Deltaproteobacteria bacterium]|nr:DUF58 domain-containing protein [Deltaproteobacteria bacterium]